MDVVATLREMKKQTLFFALFFSLVLLGAAYMQIHLKPKAQLLVVMFAVVMLWFQYYGIRILFFLMFALVSATGYSMLLGKIYKFINPDDGWIIINGERERVMSSSWIPIFLISLVLALITFRYYNKYKNIKLERVVVSALVVISTCIAVLSFSLS